MYMWEVEICTCSSTSHEHQLLQSTWQIIRFLIIQSLLRAKNPIKQSGGLTISDTMSVCTDGSMSNYVSQKRFISIWDIFLSFQYEKYLKRFNMKHKGIGDFSIWNVTFMIEAEADESSVSFKSLLDRWPLYTCALTWRTGFSWLPYSTYL